MELTCPRCGNTDEFDVSITATMTLRGDGSWDISDPDWDDDSEVTCVECDAEGLAHEFTKKRN